MNARELLKKEKGKYDTIIYYYKEYKKYPPFYLSDRDERTMNVIDYFYQDKSFKNISISDKTISKLKKERCLIVVWEK